MNRIWKNEALLNVLNKRYINEQKKKGVNFKETKNYWKKRIHNLQKNKKQIQNLELNYPSYFVSKNLNLVKAFETSCYSESHALLVVKDIKNNECFQCSPQEALSIYNTFLIDVIKKELQEKTIKSVADFGCGTGNITHLLAINYKNAVITGLDLSANHLSIAMYNFNEQNIQWIHANMEFSNLQEDSYDAIIICQTFHEMIPQAIKNTLKEVFKLLCNKGKLLIIDMDPELLPQFPSSIDINEPYLKQYRHMDLTNELFNAGFQNCKRIHLHQTTSLFVGTKV